MNKKYIIRKNEEIQKIKESMMAKSQEMMMIYRKYNRYCISVSKKIGKAVTRNLYKRRIKDILMKNNINNSNDYVIILRNSILDIDYKIIECELIKLVKGEI